MPFVETDDNCEIYYESTGSGPVIAFAPGFMGIADIWREQVARFSATHRCITFDTRGAGRSDKPIPRVSYGVDRHARDLDVVLEHLGVDRCVIIGHSMGGNIACRFHRRHPERVAGIVFVGSYVAGRQIVEAGNTLERIKAAVTMKSDRVKFYEAVGLPSDIAVEATKWPLYAVLGNAESFIEFDGHDDIRGIAAPCLIVHGDRDIVSPLEPCATALQAGLAHAELVELRGVNHCPMIEAPEPTNAAMARYFDSLGSW